MTSITFPRLMPTTGSMSQTFEPQLVDFLSPEAGGRLGAVSAGETLWSMSLTLNNMSFDDADIVRAWLASLRGAQRRFIAFDIDRQVPRFHAGGIPYQKSPTAWSQTINGDGVALLALTGLFAGQVVSVGDYVGFIWETSKLALVRAIETVIADGAGALTVAVEPPVPALVPGSATTNLQRASCLMRISSSDTKLAEQGLGYFTSGSKIVGVQDLVA